MATHHTAIITGASSGIGRCLALLYAKRGWHVGLIARGAAGLNAVYQDVTAFAPAAIACADVADAAALERAACVIEAALGQVDLWINSAGNGVYGRFIDVTSEEFHRVTDVTYLGVVNGTRVALQRMLPRGRGDIVTVCSAVAYRGLPALSSYSGAKSAVRGFSQSVRAELMHERSPVRLTTVFPPAVNTPFFSHAPSHFAAAPRPARPVYQPEIIAEAIYDAALSRRGRNGREVAISGVTRLFDLSTRLLPRVVDWLIAQLGYGGQLTDLPEAIRLHEPTLFAPSPTPSATRGPFMETLWPWSASNGKNARSYNRILRARFRALCHTLLPRRS